MAFSILQTIHPIYTIPDSNSVNVMLSVGASIKDLPADTETTMKKANNVAVNEAKQQYEADSIQFDKDFQAAEIKAKNAEKIIYNTRNKKAIAITLLVATIITTIATVVAAAITQTWAILFIAVPCLVGLVPSSYYTHIFTASVNQLENDITAPSKMKRPILNLPIYNPKLDMDLLQSRIDAQNKLAQMSIKEIFDTNISNDEIVGYELLNRVAQIQPEKRPAFYAKCIKLINGYGQIYREHQQYHSKAESDYKKLCKELRDWKFEQDSYLQSQEFALDEQERITREIGEARRRGEFVNVYPRSIVGTIVSRWQLANMKSQVAERYGRRDAQNRNCYDTAVQAIKSAYQQASANIENQYSEAKAAAV